MGVYMCLYKGEKAVIEIASDREEAKRIFLEYLERYCDIHAYPEEVRAEYITVITRRRGFAEAL